MSHAICRVRSVDVLDSYRVRVQFDDGTAQFIDFEPVLRGRLYGPLQDRALFAQVRVDPEVHTLVWPNGADFDAETLYNWPRYAPALAARAARWDASAGR